MQPSIYESKALREIHKWKDYEPGRFEKFLKPFLHKFDDISGWIKSVDPGLIKTLNKAMEGLLLNTNDLCMSTVRTKAILMEMQKYTEGTVTIDSLEEIIKLDLSDADRIASGLDAKYRTASAIQGGGSAAAGLPGLVADVPALIAVNLRAIGEYASYYGFDINRQEEKLFALNVLGFASSFECSSKQAAMAHMIKIAGDVARKKTWQELEKSVIVRLVQMIFKSVGQRLTKAKLAQIIPAIGILIGGGFNSWYTNRVITAAGFLYRERFLAQKYGYHIIEITVNPSTSFETGYEDMNLMVS